ncbi:MAG: T9SS type A sorting domain-containing protein [Crocinitomicaceae bacterium]|nr:T9SS type A sorting domain-containing protein [Crocinitomicaceae bacterium]
MMKTNSIALLAVFVTFFTQLKAQIIDQTVVAITTTICENGSATITTGGSELGVDYYLRDDSDSSIVVGPLAGTGGPGSGLTFNIGLLTSTTTYHVYAEKLGVGLDFDDVDDRVQISPIPPLSGSFSVMGWVRTTAGSIRQIIGWGAASGISKYVDFSIGFGKLRYYSRNTNVNTDFIGGNIIVNDGNWHHIAFTKNGGTNQVSLYVDGVLDVQGISTVLFSPMANTTLGANYANNSYQGKFNGAMDELSVWSSELSIAQIQDDMNNGTSAAAANLEAYFDFEENGGTTVGDNSPNSHIGTMTNMDASNDWIVGVVKDRLIMSSTQTITVNPLPTVVANTTSAAICAGNQVTLTGSGASTYAWDNGVGDNVAFTPGATITYTLTGTDVNSCTNTDQLTVTVNSLPTVVANSSAAVVCEGNQITLTGSGTSIYSWNNGVTNNNAFAPASTTTYTVTGTDGNNCSNIDQITITVNATPVVSANSTSTTICAGDQITLTGGGASTYAWDNSATDNVAFAPILTTTYMVTGTDGNNCSTTAQVTVTVNALPTVVANATVVTICAGDQITLSGAGASTYTWDNGATDNTAFAPAATTTYIVTGTDGNNCSNTDQVSITVNALPTVVANSTSTTICADDQITLTGTGASAYTWDNGVDDNVSFIPTATTIYTVTGTDMNNCSSTAMITVTVNTIDNTVSVAGLTITATASTGTYQWLDCDNVNSAISGETNQLFTATANGNYAVEISENGCVDTSDCISITTVGIENKLLGLNVSVYPNPTSGNVTIDLGKEYVNVDITLMDITGKVVSTSSYSATDKVLVNIEGTAGVYFLNIQSEDKGITVKLLKN